MTDFKQIERECFDYLKTKFSHVVWLSQFSPSPIDFKCVKDDIEFFIECKFTTNGKVYLLPSQRKVDAVVLHNGKEIDLIWKKDFDGKIRFSNTCGIKITEDLKRRLDLLKEYERETYTEIIERLYSNNK